MRRFRDRSFRAKVFVTLIVVVISAFMVNSIIVSNSAGAVAEKNGRALATSIVREYARFVEGQMNEDFALVRALGVIFSDYETLPVAGRREEMVRLLRILLEKNPNFVSTWTMWEPGKPDNLALSLRNGDLGNENGNFLPTLSRAGGGIRVVQSGDSEFAADFYTMPKRTRKESVLNPYRYSYSGKKEDEFLITSLCVPVLVGGEFRGVVGVDIDLKRFVALLAPIKPYETGFLQLAANDGTFVFHRNPDVIGRRFADFRP